MITAQLQHAIEAAQRLSPHEKHQLIEIVARSLTLADALETGTATFLRGRTLDELIAEQQPPIITDIGALAADYWPEDESADDVNTYIEAQRRAEGERPL
jgi:hypothetical protein